MPFCGFANNWLLMRVLLDTETTALYGAEIVGIAIVNPLGEPLLNTLIKPTIPIPSKARQIHGITDKRVADVAAFPGIYPQIAKVFKDKRILIYNAEFDIIILNYCCELYNLSILKLQKRSEFLMEWAAQWRGDWSNNYKDYKYFPLPDGNHRALGDCIAALELIKRIAAGPDRINCPVPIPEGNQ